MTKPLAIKQVLRRIDGSLSSLSHPCTIVLSLIPEQITHQVAATVIGAGASFTVCGPSVEDALRNLAARCEKMMSPAGDSSSVSSDSSSMWEL